LQTFLLCFVLANTLLVSLALWLVHQKIGKVTLIWNREAFISLLRASLPFFVLALLSMAHFNIDLLLLGLLESYLVTAVYGAGFKLLEASRFLIRPVVLIFFPLCTEMVARHNWQEVRTLFKKMLVVTGGFGGSMTLIILLAADWIILAVFGTQYQESATILKVLSVSIPSLYMATMSTLLANAMQLEKKMAKIMCICIAGQTVFCGTGILFWGAQGAAWATVISEGIIAAWLTRLTFRELRISCTI
jgi:O-antigen/teichoic acid export membrane protein